MNLLRSGLNAYLKLTERRFLETVQEPAKIRASLERNARLFFHPPRGARKKALTLGGRPALEVSCGPLDGTILLYFHGGAYVFGSPQTHWAMLARLCSYGGFSAVLPDYRKAPETPHPGALEDAVSSYLALMSSGARPERVVLGGDSAGGGLALALLAELIARGHPLPGGCFAFSPLTDLTFSGASVRENAQSDVVLPASRVREMAEVFLAGQEPRDPRASPLFAKFDDAPAVWITAGDTEILRDDSRRMVEHLRDAGVSVSYAEVRDWPHVWPIFQSVLPQARTTLRDLAAWIKQQVPPQS